MVEDDDAAHAFLLENLAADGFRVAGASSAGDYLGQLADGSQESMLT